MRKLRLSAAVSTVLRPRHLGRSSLRWLGFAALGLLALVAVSACDSANPVAPSGTVLTVTANPTQIGLSGSSNITVTGFKPDGNPLNPNTQLQVSTSLGTITPTVISTDNNGRASASLTADGRTGTATVSVVTVGGGEPQTIDVQIGETDETRPVLLISAAPSTIDFNESTEVTVIARRADGSPFGAGGLVNLRTSLGTFSNGQTAISLRTDSRSEVKAELTAGEQPGTATVTAVLGSSAEVTADVTVENQRPVLLISADRTTIPVGGSTTITVIARDNNGVSLGSGRRVRLTASLGSLSNTQPVTDANGETTAIYTAFDRAGQGEVVAILGTSEPAPVSITISDAPGALDFQADPRSVARGADRDIALAATVSNTLGNPLGGIRVVFNTEGVGGSFTNGTNVVTTGGATGRAETTLTVPQSDLDNVTSFEVIAIVRGEGVELIERITITVTQ